MTTIKITNMQGLVDLIDSTLGFHPTDSLVLLATKPAVAVARIDLSKDRVVEAVGSTVEPFNKHGFDRILVLAYTANEQLARPATAGAAANLIGRTLLRCWVTPDGRVENLDTGSVEGTTPVISRGRDSMVSDLAPAEERFEEVDLAWSEREAARWLQVNTRRLYDGFAMSPVDAATFAWCVGKAPAVRDFAWGGLDRRRAALATDTLRLTFPHLSDRDRRAVAPVFGFAAWLAGNGALGWEAVDFTRDADTLGRMVTELLEGAVNPNWWEPLHPSVENIAS